MAQEKLQNFQICKFSLKSPAFVVIECSNSNCVYISIRGTYSHEDVLKDLSFKPYPISVTMDGKQVEATAHTGMWEAAVEMYKVIGPIMQLSVCMFGILKSITFAFRPYRQL